MTTWKVTFEGWRAKGALGTPSMEFYWETPPDIIRMGDGSLWIWKTRPAVARGHVHYEPAVIEDITWLHRAPVEENNDG